MQTTVMGILNITPDSFSGDGLAGDQEKAVERGLTMLNAGAGILDVGGESTRPGKHEALSAEQEIDRVLPVIQALLEARPDALISIDTYKAKTARVAVAAGAQIVNDVSGFLWDSEMAETCADLQCGVVLMHTRGRPDEWKTLPRLSAEDVAPMVKADLSCRLQAAMTAGVRSERIVLDPGIGFGKAYESNYALLARLDELRELGKPLLCGVSRKSFLGRTLAALYGRVDAAVIDRSNATLAAVTASVLAGADLVRVHEVPAAVEAAAIADAILAASRSE
ncbi:Dihydropteroate synthase [Acidisarcina polymorpha]|uniref:dihydropteroate synthase n=1 Tax=Acidisarcina polymorpha TaxID=2211140 RepID=A0A2Z5G3Y8_9BACT|nr:Dihydropteroate synthase [Acidisarcina polymorpha]